MRNRTQREQRRAVIAKPESRLLMFKIELDTRSHRHRGDERREQQHNVNPQPASRWLDDPDFVRMHWFRRDRKRGSGFGHTVAELLIRYTDHEKCADLCFRDFPALFKTALPGEAPGLPSQSTVIPCQA